jgi:EpsI family protein
VKFLNHPAARVLTVVIVLQAFAYYAIASRSELVPPMAPLSTFPLASQGWQCVRQEELDKDIQELLKADDTISRIYVSPSKRESASLFMAFFKTQRYGQSPHSPKNCLPGNGWDEVSSGTLAITVPDWNGPIKANQYVVAHGEDKDMVIYWYQSHNRIVASEYAARFWLVLDAMRYRRSDTSIVRVITRIENNDYEHATQLGVGFIQAIFPDILKHLPA